MSFSCPVNELDNVKLSPLFCCPSSKLGKASLSVVLQAMLLHDPSQRSSDRGGKLVRTLAWTTCRGWRVLESLQPCSKESSLDLGATYLGQGFRMKSIWDIKEFPCKRVIVKAPPPGLVLFEGADAGRPLEVGVLFQVDLHVVEGGHGAHRVLSNGAQGSIDHFFDLPLSFCC